MTKKSLETELNREKALNKVYEDNNRQLREMIEKMKCCYNCKHSRTEYEHCKTDKSEKWEIKEK
jgi:2-oxoglutarate dehydrogenase complex dehydrogenase (E1) component-like enzyme